MKIWWMLRKITNNILYMINVYLKVEKRILKIFKSTLRKKKKNRHMTHPENQKHAWQICGRGYGWEGSWVGGINRIVPPLARGGLSPHPALQALLLAARFCGKNQPFCGNNGETGSGIIPSLKTQSKKCRVSAETCDHKSQILMMQCVRVFLIYW